MRQDRTLPTWPASGKLNPAKPREGFDEKRERILHVAEKLFAKQGYANTTMAQIVATMGMTKPFVYYYFRNKQEIFETLSWQPTVECFTSMDFSSDDPSPAHAKLEVGLRRLIGSTLK